MKKNEKMVWLAIGVSFTILYIIKYGLEGFLQQLVNGLQLGSLYALIALGYTMVYGIIKLINFAHGDLFMFGAYISAFTGTFLAGRGLIGLAFIPAMLLSMIVTAVLGMSIEKIAYKPLRNKPRLSVLITALGVSLFLENFFALPSEKVFFPFDKVVFGPNMISFPKLIDDRIFNISGISISMVKSIDFFVAILLMIILELIVKKTKIGKAMRAVSFNRDASYLMGIDVNFIIMVTFGIGTSLASAAGTLYALTFCCLDNPFMGIWPGIKAFIAAVLGGIGNIPGAMLGGFLMGIIETYASSINPQLGDISAFSLLIIVLIFKPAGLMGKFEIEKV